MLVVECGRFGPLEIPMLSARLHVWSIGLAVTLVCAATTQPHTQARAGAPQDKAPTPDKTPQPHYADALRAHDAVIRGDLTDVRAAAQQLRAAPDPAISAKGLTPEKVLPYTTALRQAADRAAQASDLTAAATSVAGMLGACGDCHRGAGTMPAMASRPAPTVGETVGHMLEHEQASQLLMQGLVVPSNVAWKDGADALRSAPIARGKLPKDPKLTAQLMEGEQRLHQLADRALSMTDTADRVAIYGEMIGTCAACHSLHPNVWGPPKR
jgi:hypothetical protein